LACVQVATGIVGRRANSPRLCKLTLGVATPIAVDPSITLLIVSNSIFIAILASGLKLPVAANAVGWRAEAVALGSQHAVDGRDGTRRELVVVGSRAVNRNGKHEV
jgi:hypothetical protein